MYASSFLLAFCLALGLVQATVYSLEDDYTDDFFGNFDFFTGPDPTEGWVDFLSYDDASASGLIKSTNPPSWGVDNNNVISPDNSAGRPSVRLTSKKTYNQGLFILDLAHMPHSACGVWPAFWTFSQTAQWPAGGEIDIIEYTNLGINDLMSLHTTDGCSIAGDSQYMTGELESNVCDVSQGSGCSINNTDSTSAGTGFNKAGGGVYAMEWTHELIQIWYFAAGSVPPSITNGQPDTALFGKVTALFQGTCNIDNHFYDHAMIFDLTFCGAWAGATFGDDGCQVLSGYDSESSCINYVGNNPHAFDNAYWTVNSLKVYKVGSNSQASSPSSGTSAVPAASTSSVGLTSQSAALGVSTSIYARSTSAASTTTSSATPTYSHYHHGPPSRRHAHRNQYDW